VTHDTTPAGCGPQGRDDKSELRRRVLEARDRMSQAELARLSVAVCERAQALPELAAAGTILLYASFRSELDTSPLLRWALARGATVCLPRILGPRRMEAYEVSDPATDLQLGHWDIPEPGEEAPLVPPERLDAVLVPGSLFDERGGRCGYGGGFYDTFLLRLRPGTPRIALGLELQLVPQVPCEPHDLPVDVIVTERRVIRRAS
jgi:5-formyltetrahydrofolate cyclo-ligase